jgi:predicted amidophosphoribosyltransferase
MPSLRDAAVAMTGVCTAVPTAGEGICRRCHGCPNPGWPLCWSCSKVENQLSRPCKLVAPISLYEIPSQLHHILKHYKSDTYRTLQAEFTTNVAALVGYFLLTHGECIRRAAGRGWDTITAVPSSTGRTGQHPLITAIDMLPGIRSEHEQLLGKGPVDVGHLRADDQGYVTTGSVNGKAILLLDDTFTTGARAQSAASALALAGADVVAIVPVGRVIDPRFSDTVNEYWRRQKHSPFDWDSCCLE